MGTISIDERWDAFRDALESGESNRVNAAIDDVEDMDLEERVQLFETCFEEVTDIYADSDDGYVRQSTVRFVEAFSPGLAVVFAAVDEESQPIDVNRETIRRQADATSGFLLEAMTDTDGRVRNSAKRALKDVFRAYDAFEDKETIAVLEAELAKMAKAHDDKRREHLLEAKADAAFFQQSGFGRLLEGFQREFGDELDLDS